MFGVSALILNPKDEMEDHKAYYDMKKPLATTGPRRFSPQQYPLFLAQVRTEYLCGLQKINERQRQS